MEQNSAAVGSDDILKRENIYLLIGCLILGVLFHILFYGKPLGISYPIFIIAFYSVLLWNSRKIIRFKFNFAWLLSIPILMLTFAYFLFSNPIFRFFNFLAVPILIFVQTTLLAGSNKYIWHTPGFLIDILNSMFIKTFGFLSKPFELISSIIIPKGKSKKYAVIGKVFVGLLISLPLLLIISALLSSADKVFETWAGNLFNYLSEINIFEFIVRLIVIFTVSVISFSYIWGLINKRKSGEAVESELPLKGVLDPIIALTVVFLISVVYITFVVIQFAYLFGGTNLALPPDFTYSEYARRGFFELVAVTLLNLGILLLNISFTREDGKVINLLNQILNSILIVCTMIMLYSAHYRMSLYEAVYGFTYLRILTHAFMVFIFALLAAAMFKVWRQKVSLIKAYAVIALIAYTTINYINIDVIIAKENIKRYNSKVSSIDAAYLTHLSHDSVPWLVTLLDNKNPDTAIKIENNLYKRKKVLESKHSWQSFNISEYRARVILGQYDLKCREEIE